MRALFQLIIFIEHMNSPVYQNEYNIKLHLSSVQDTSRPHQLMPSSHLLGVNLTPQRKMSNGSVMGMLQLPKNEPSFLRKTIGATHTLEPSRSNRKLDPFLRNTYFALNSPLLSSSKLSPAVQNDSRQRSQQKSKSFMGRKQETEEKEPQKIEENGGSHYNKIMEKIDKKQKLIYQLKKLSSFKLSEQIKPIHEVDTLNGRMKGHQMKAEKLISAHNSPIYLHNHTSINKMEDLNKSAVNENKNVGSFAYLKEKNPNDVAVADEKESDYKIVIKNPEDDKKGRVPHFIPKTNKASTETKIETRFTPKINTTKELSSNYLASSQAKAPQRSNSNANYKELESPMPKLAFKNSMQEIKTMTQVKQLAQKRSRTNSFAQKKLQISDFSLGKSLGQGKFGTVYQAVHKETNWLVALKKITKKSITSNYMIDQFLMQVKIQTFCNHENILKLYGCFDDKEHIYLVLEYMEEGTLFGVLKKNKTLNEEEAAEKLRQVAEAVNYLHDIGIAHRDIKPENIVISNGVGKLCDLGWAAVCNDRRKTYCGTFDYAAPEILQGEEYDMSVDLWCLGVLAFELLAGKAPFYHISRKETMKRIMNVESNAITYPETMSENAKSFIENLIKRKPEERMTAEHVLKHPFLAK